MVSMWLVAPAPKFLLWRSGISGGGKTSLFSPISPHKSVGPPILPRSNPGFHNHPRESPPLPSHCA